MKKLSYLASLLLIAAFSLAMVSCSNSGAASNDVDSGLVEQVKKEVEDLKAQLPIDIGPLSFTDVEYDEDSTTMVYIYTWKDEYNGTEFDQDAVMEAKESTISSVKQGILANTQVRPYLENGIRFAYRYLNPEGELLYEFSIDGSELEEE